MRSTVHVAFQFVKNRFRSRLSVRNLPIVIIVAVPILLYLLFGTSTYLGYDNHVDKVDVNRLSGKVRSLLKLPLTDSRLSPSLDVTGHRDNVPPHKEVQVQTTNSQPVDYIATIKSFEKSNRGNDIHHTISNLSLSFYDQNSHHLLPIRGVLPRVLLIYDNFSIDSAKRMKVFLQSQRIDFDLFSTTKNRTPPPLSKFSSETDEVIGRYALILCADIGFLLQRLAQNVRQVFFEYSRAFNVTIISVKRTAFDHLRSSAEANFTFGSHHFYPVRSWHMSHMKVDHKRHWLFTKGGVAVTDIPKSAHWQVLLSQPITSQMSNHMSGERVAQGERETAKKLDSKSHLSLAYVQRKLHDDDPNVLVKLMYTLNDSLAGYVSEQTSPLAWIDHNVAPGAVVVLIGMDMRFWLTSLLLLDMINTFSKPSLLRFGNERWVMVDIDDIFVAPQGLRMTAEDVEALIEAQEKFKDQVPGFKFNLGFCGYYYDRGSEAEQLGNQKLVQNANKFNWFGHMYNHYQPHNLTEEILVDYMTKNQQFALTQGIEIASSSYSVTPHHSGIYPIHQPLYNAWRRVWNVTMTSTEEYPHLYPGQLRRGFIYQGVMVLPRQTCQLYTHTYSYSTFKGGRNQLIASAEGGSVFSILLHNPVSIFMTHVTNYAVDRLAPELFEHLFDFVQRWTNLNLVSGPPLTLGKIYFDIFPEDNMPFWTCPCSDKRHLEIMPAGKNCSRFPSLLVIGPQKSGTTALYSFLRIHPSVASNHLTQDHFEEIQFFSNSTLYLRGVEWYMDQFPYPDESTILFEKSATYLSNPLAPQRAFSLLPRAKLIAILHDPVKRAYSWYQHMRAHNDPTALSHNFSQVIRATPNLSTNKKLLSLRDHCLGPGRYHIHLSKWLKYYHSKQLCLVDGQELADNPASVMDQVQRFLQLDRNVNYTKILRYSNKKGFHCLSMHGKFHCLGASKGRHYPAMEMADIAYLKEFYHHDNLLLMELLKKFSFHPPTWLSVT